MEMSGSLHLPALPLDPAPLPRLVLDRVLARRLALGLDRVLLPLLPALDPVLRLAPARVPLPEMERSFSTTPRRFKQRTVY